MSFKRTDLAKQLGLKIRGQMQHASIPGRFAQAPEQLDRREQRKLDQAAGLVPFAVKINKELVAQLTERAATLQVPLQDLVDQLLRAGLDSAENAAPAKKAAATKTATKTATKKAATKKTS